MSETDLTIESAEINHAFPPFSSRECKQTLTSLPTNSVRRTINGKLISVGYEGHRKFRSLISCKDQAPPAFSSLWEGVLVKVGCIQHLTQFLPPGSRKVRLERPPLSFHVYDQTQKLWEVPPPQDRWLSLPSIFPGGFITYRPSLLMVVQKYHLETEEWGQSVKWELALEEQ